MNGELYPGEFEAMERQGRLDATIPEQKMMTREEIIDGLEIYTVGRLNKDRVHITVEELQKFIDAIKALEKETCETIHGSTYGGVSWSKPYKPQQPSDDAISRQAVLSMQYRIDDSATLSMRYVVNVDDIEDLPPVTVEPKTAHWIDSSNGWMCSKCERDNTFDTNYCPNCGRRMIEIQESEDRE